jgi:hypothetical protein
MQTMASSYIHRYEAICDSQRALHGRGGGGTRRPGVCAIAKRQENVLTWKTCQERGSIHRKHVRPDRPRRYPGLGYCMDGR